MILNTIPVWKKQTLYVINKGNYWIFTITIQCMIRGSERCSLLKMCIMEEHEKQARGRDERAVSHNNARRFSPLLFFLYPLP